MKNKIFNNGQNNLHVVTYIFFSGHGAQLPNGDNAGLVPVLDEHGIW